MNNPLARTILASAAFCLASQAISAEDRDETRTTVPNERAIQAVRATPAIEAVRAAPRGSNTAVERLALTPSLTGIEPDEID